jgi:GAF domain-containing protein
MNTDRLLRDIERRLSHLPAADRAEALDAVREEIGRDRRREGPVSTVESERERRLEAESLRAILEAINHQATLDQTIDEVLKQLARIVVFDSCSVALVDADETFRIIAARGYPDPAKVVGLTFRDELTEMLRRSTSAVSVGDVLHDPRFRTRIPGTREIRSWAGIPLLVEGEVIGVLNLDRHLVDPFDDEDLHRAKAVAFSAAAAIRKAQLMERVRRYAALMERLVAVDQAVFAGDPVGAVALLVLEGALGIGSYSGGVLVLDAGGTPRSAASAGAARVENGSPMPAAFSGKATARLSADEAARIAARAKIKLPKDALFLVPVRTSSRHLGALVLCDPNGPSADDRLMESYASRAAAALLHATRGSVRPAKPPGRIARARAKVGKKVNATIAARLKSKMKPAPKKGAAKRK